MRPLQPSGVTQCTSWLIATMRKAKPYTYGLNFAPWHSCSTLNRPRLNARWQRAVATGAAATQYCPMRGFGQCDATRGANAPPTLVRRPCHTVAFLGLWPIWDGVPRMSLWRRCHCPWIVTVPFLGHPRIFGRWDERVSSDKIPDSFDASSS